MSKRLYDAPLCKQANKLILRIHLLHFIPVDGHRVNYHK